MVITNGEAVTFDPRVNDTDADNDALTVSAFTQGTVGTVTLSGADITYAPGPQFFGRDSFTYTVTDGSASASSTVVVQSTAHHGGRAGDQLQVPDQPGGTLYGSLGLPTNGVFSGTVQSGTGIQQRAIFGANGEVILKVGDAAPWRRARRSPICAIRARQAVLATVRRTAGERSQ